MNGRADAGRKAGSVASGEQTLAAAHLAAVAGRTASPTRDDRTLISWRAGNNRYRARGGSLAPAADIPTHYMLSTRNFLHAPLAPTGLYLRRRAVPRRSAGEKTP